MGTWFERLSSLDSLFLELEDRTAHMHVGAVAVFEGKAPPYRDLLQLIEARLHRVPRYRQRVQFVPFKQGRPVWIDESQFDLEYHVRHTALPAPGGDEELKRLAGRLFSQALDRDKPLWELWLVEGLGGDGSAGDGRTPKAGASGDRFAIISKTHHCMLDGISGVDLATVLMDTEPSTEAPAAPAEWKPRPAPKTSELLATSFKEQITNPIQVVREALHANNDARKLLREIAGGLKPLLGLAGMGLAPAQVRDARPSPPGDPQDPPGAAGDRQRRHPRGRRRSAAALAGSERRVARTRPARPGAGQHARRARPQYLREPGLGGLLPAAGRRGESGGAVAQGARGDEGDQGGGSGGRGRRARLAQRLRPTHASRPGGAAAGGHALLQPGGHQRARAAVPLVPPGTAAPRLLPAGPARRAAEHRRGAAQLPRKRLCRAPRRSRRPRPGRAQRRDARVPARAAGGRGSSARAGGTPDTCPRIEP